MGKFRIQFIALLLAVIALFFGIIVVDLHFFGRMTNLHRLEARIARVFLHWTRLVGQSSGYLISNETIGQAYNAWKKEYDAYATTWQSDLDELERLAEVDDVLTGQIAWVRGTLKLGVTQMALMDEYLGKFMSNVRLHQPEIIDRNSMASLSDNQNKAAILSPENKFYLNMVRDSCHLLGNMMETTISTAQTRFQNQVTDRIRTIRGQFTRIRLLLIGLILGVLIVFLLRIIKLNFDLMAMVRRRTSELERARSELEHRVIERTMELQTVNLHLEEEVKVRKHTESVLQESEEQFRFLFETMAQGVIVRDAESKVVDVNDAACDILGLSKDQLLGRTGYDPRWKLIHEDGSPLAPEEMPSNMALRTGKPVTNILLGAYSVAHERYHWILTSSTPKFKEGENTPYRTMTTFSDITHQKRAEAEIRQLNQELEQRVFDRTAQLEAANKELEAFAYSVSHDLRAPLRHIDGFLELLQKRTTDALDEQSRHYMDTITKSATRMGALIDDLLSFSRMGRADMDRHPVDLATLVREALRDLEPDTSGRTIHWQIADLPVVMGDRAMLRMVLVNLLANAIKFTQPRLQAEIEIGCQPGQGEVVVFVRDNGVGFDMQYADKMFGVFQRLHRAEDFEGTGIGLASVHRIIVRHGGRTWACGQVDQGATFYFSIP